MEGPSATEAFKLMMTKDTTSRSLHTHTHTHTRIYNWLAKEFDFVELHAERIDWLKLYLQNDRTQF